MDKIKYTKSLKDNLYSFLDNTNKLLSESTIYTKHNFDKIVNALVKTKIRATVRLLKDNIIIELGFDFPDREFHKITSMLEKMGIPPNSITICADHGGPTPIEIKRINGGKPKHWF